MAGHCVKPRVRLQVLARDRFTCRYCYGPGETIDHVIPWSECHDSRQFNLVAACEACNGAAADLVFDTLAGKQDYILGRRGLPPAPYRLDPAEEPDHHLGGRRASGVLLGERFPGLGQLLDQLT